MAQHLLVRNKGNSLASEHKSWTAASQFLDCTLGVCPVEVFYLLSCKPSAENLFLFSSAKGDDSCGTSSRKHPPRFARACPAFLHFFWTRGFLPRLLLCRVQVSPNRRCFQASHGASCFSLKPENMPAVEGTAPLTPAQADKRVTTDTGLGHCFPASLL